MLDGFWLPELDAVDVEVQERVFGPGRVEMRVPVFTPHALRELLVALREDGVRYLAARRVTDILEVIEAAAQKLTRPDGPYYAELVRVLPELTGYSKRMIEIGLERMGAGWTSRALRGALEGEFGSPQVLDGFQPRAGGGFARAFGASLTVHIFSGNIPGVSVSSLIRALCVKSPSFGKTAAGEPYFAVCFARALAERDPELARCIAVAYWPGGSEDLEAVAFSEAGAVIAYGSDEAVASAAARVPPDTCFIGYPHRVGAALVARSALSGASTHSLARAAAMDVAVFDQQGCVAPHVIYVERGGEVGPLAFAHELAAALDVLAREIPRGVLAPGESSLIHQVRAEAEMRGATVLASERGTEWTVIVEERAEFEASPLNRVIHLRPVGDLSDAIAALERVGRRLQTVAVAGRPGEVESLAARLGAIGATRVVPLGQAAWPSHGWHHDGRFQFLDLVRFVDLELGGRAEEE
jgi:hypothetical protein